MAGRERCQAQHTSAEGGLQVAVPARELDQARVVLAVCLLLQPPGEGLIIAVLLLLALACAWTPETAMQRLQCCAIRALDSDQICFQPLRQGLH